MKNYWLNNRKVKINIWAGKNIASRFTGKKNNRGEVLIDTIEKPRSAIFNMNEIADELKLNDIFFKLRDEDGYNKPNMDFNYTQQWAQIPFDKEHHLADVWFRKEDVDAICARQSFKKDAATAMNEHFQEKYIKSK
jgi:hypothetical protein